MSRVLEVKDLKLVLGGRTILDIPDFSVNREESVSIMGPNGAGKSSLLFILAALQEPTKGTVLYFGREMKEQSGVDVRRRMAMVFQKPMLLSGTVMENVEMGLKFRNLTRKERERLVRPWLEKLSIDHLARQRAHSLSGGEAQRVALAQAMVLEPEVIFLDEPFANLDKGIRQELIDEIGTIMRRLRITTVMVTHSRTEAAAITNKIYLLEDGEIIETEDL